MAAAGFYRIPMDNDFAKLLTVINEKFSDAAKKKSEDKIFIVNVAGKPMIAVATDYVALLLAFWMDNAVTNVDANMRLIDRPKPINDLEFGVVHEIIDRLWKEFYCLFYEWSLWQSHMQIKPGSPIIKSISEVDTFFKEFLTFVQQQALYAANSTSAYAKKISADIVKLNDEFPLPSPPKNIARTPAGVVEL